ncbi:sodium:solute symporter family protein [Marinilongibacter aquaticus]|uniref:sodium:solute symporter family protein n=1 Tax=Marinilongibacter aquaticus TaxID=2975157 RepID=UPI0021BD3BAD|nr:sodium:solute symporter family protein [Marinilongibacter aquaticus]UBM59247.1 sodium:solute symporter family protein [Marinilongibacter aquaticus]
MLIFCIFLYLLCTVAIGWYASRFVHNAQDFAIAGRRMPTYVVASGLFATWFGSETIMGAPSEFLSNGLLGVIEDPFGAALCLFMIGFFFAKPLYKLNILTFSDYFRIRFSKKVEWISALFMIPSYFSWIAAQLVALAVILQSVSGLPFQWGIFLGALVVTFYTYVGGMWSVAITDTIQTLIIVLGLGYLAISLFLDLGFTALKAYPFPEDFFRFTPKSQSVSQWLLYFSAWITIGWGSTPQQDIFQRVLSAKSAKVAVQGAHWSGFMYLSIAILPLAISLFGKILYPEIGGDDPQMAIPQLVLKHTALGMQIIFFGALLSAILSTCSGAVLAPATVFGENLIRPLWGKKIDDENLLKMMRLSVVFIMCIAVFMAFQRGNIYELVGESSALSLVALFVPLVAGLYWKKAQALGAILSMCLGTASWGILNFVYEAPLAMLYGLLFSIIGMWIGSIPALSKNASHSS